MRSGAEMVELLVFFKLPIEQCQSGGAGRGLVSEQVVNLGSDGIVFAV